MNKDEIKKSLAVCVGASCEGCAYHDDLTCIDTLKTDARKCIIKQEKEIKRLREKLTKVLLAIDTVKEMNTMVDIHEQIKQAKIDVLNEVNEKINVISREFGEFGDYGITATFKCSCAIDELIREVQNGENKSRN